MRCSRGRDGCGRRFTLKKHPDQYRRTVRCPYCKSYNVTDVEAARRAEQARKDTCRCPNYPFPHTKGTMRMCDHHPLVLAGVDVTEIEYGDYMACLATPRSDWR